MLNLQIGDVIQYNNQSGIIKKIKIIEGGFDKYVVHFDNGDVHIFIGNIDDYNIRLNNN